MSRLIIESDTHGWLELDRPVSMPLAAAIRAEFAKVPWPPSRSLTLMGEPVEVVDRRPREPTTRRILLDRGPRPTRPDPGRVSAW